MIETLTQLAYLFAALLFITALRALGRPDSARRGMQLAAFGMAVAVIATLFQTRIVSYEWIVVGAAVGAIAGYPLGMWVPMTAMPQRIALSHAFGALAATLVGIGEYANGSYGGTLVRPNVAALGLEVLFGGVNRKAERSCTNSLPPPATSKSATASYRSPWRRSAPRIEHAPRIPSARFSIGLPRCSRALACAFASHTSAAVHRPGFPPLAESPEPCPGGGPSLVSAPKPDIFFRCYVRSSEVTDNSRAPSPSKPPKSPH